MSKIHVMSENLANKIAAGEVIEKCSSVVKELVENSIDAGATQIEVALTNGGIEGIRVTDNGSGMEHEDALLAFSRHATSKLIREDDLFFIDTLGFRGEALPSIASVSDVDLTTCASKVGSHIHIRGGEFITDEASDARKGTRFEVTNLFFNTPARLKYLKSEQTELANSVSLLEKLALSYPYIQFTLLHNEKVLMQTSGSGDLKKTIHEIYGIEISSKLIEVSKSNDDYDVYGYICKPEVLKSTRNYMITFVNGRVVKNYDLNRAINDAYYTYKPDSKYPVVFLNIQTDPTLIDVNIHPTKSDIKMSKLDGLYQLIVSMIKDALYQNFLAPDALVRIAATSDILTKEEIHQIVEEKVSEIPVVEEQTTLELTTHEEDTPKVNEEIRHLELHPLCQIHRTYIVCENEDGLYLMDQHAAHERINYENFFKKLKEKQVTTTQLLIPITLEFSTSDFMKVKHHLDDLANMGIILEEFGLNTYRVVEHPTWFKEGYEEEGIRRTIDLLVEEDSHFDSMKFREKACIMLACKMAIKANMDASQEMMEQICHDLVLCDNPYNCPHGRPTFIKFSNYDLERMFKRVMN